jgi:hypothetical protein
MDPEITTLREFVSFANDILGKKNKLVEKLYKLVAKPATLTVDQIQDIKKAFARCFQNLDEWENFTGNNFIEYKSGRLSLGELEKRCKKNSEDKQVWDEYMATLRSLYMDLRKTLMGFLKKLDLDEDSAESKFMFSLLNELGGEVLESIMKNGGQGLDMTSVLPKVMEIVQNGKISTILETLKSGQVKLYKILNAGAKLLQQYEESGETPAITASSSTSTSVDEVKKIEN